jgi:pimeloyl-ACP methyl ester carboxylesterase
MATITTDDGTEIFCKDWGSGQPVVFSHGWPLNADAWDDQSFLVASNGFRAVAHDRRGHGRSSQPWDGNDMDTYADDLAALIEALDLKDAILVGHSTGGGEVTRYIGRHGTSRVAKALLLGAVPPLMLKTEANPGGLPIEAFDQIRRPLAVLQGPERVVLRRQQGRLHRLAGGSRLVLANGHAGGSEGRARLHQGLLRDGLHGGSQEDRRFHADRARRRRSDRADRRVGRKVIEARSGLNPEGLSRRPSRAIRHA